MPQAHRGWSAARDGLHDERLDGPTERTICEMSQQLLLRALPRVVRPIDLGPHGVIAIDEEL